MSNKCTEKEYRDLNLAYQTCFNIYLDKFMEGQDVEFDGICKKELELLKNCGDTYKNMEKEFEIELNKNTKK